MVGFWPGGKLADRVVWGGGGGVAGCLIVHDLCRITQQTRHIRTILV